METLAVAKNRDKHFAPHTDGAATCVLHNMPLINLV